MSTLIDRLRQSARTIGYLVQTNTRPKWLIELQRKQDARLGAIAHRRGQRLTSEGWAGVMVLLGILLGILVAWKNGLLK